MFCGRCSRPPVGAGSSLLPCIFVQSVLRTVEWAAHLQDWRQVRLKENREVLMRWVKERSVACRSRSSQGSQNSPSCCTSPSPSLSLLLRLDQAGAREARRARAGAVYN